MIFYLVVFLPEALLIVGGDLGHVMLAVALGAVDHGVAEVTLLLHVLDEALGIVLPLVALRAMELTPEVLPPVLVQGVGVGEVLVANRADNRDPLLHLVPVQPRLLKLAPRHFRSLLLEAVILVALPLHSLGIANVLKGNPMQNFELELSQEKGFELFL